MKKLYLLIILIAFYSMGFITNHYKLPPYNLIKTIVKGDNNLEKTNPGQDNIQGKMSFFNTFSPKGEIVFVGDSITDGAEWYVIFNNKRVINLGIGWNTITNINKNKDLILNTSAKHVFIMGGVNDLMVMGYDVAHIGKEYKELISSLSQKKINVIVQSTLKTRRGDDLNEKITQLNLLLEAYCKETKMCEFININDVMAEEDELKRAYTIDGVHLNGLGYEVWSNRIESLYESLPL